MFDTLIVQPIFNLLVLIYALLPGHNLGLAIILFTIVVRILMWPLVKKQLHQVKLMRKVQPELKRIKKAANGDRQKESMMMLELYKERGISPFGQIGILLLQLPILLGLYLGLQRILRDPHELVSFAYPFLQDLSWMKQLADNIDIFDATLFGVVDLTRSALGDGIYWPALLIVIASAVAQYYQSKQLTPDDKDARGLRAILRDAKQGKQADSSEVNAAMGRSTRYILPILVLLFTVHIASALSLYWLVSGLVAFIQQTIVLRDDATEMDAIADGKDTDKTSKIAERAKHAVEAEVVATPKANAKSKAARKKRRSKK
ncbi:MAG TPA: YidC/Oxa1 family membrane protein insertase [Candidatus Saccharimonadales bacterium]|nr:YidC/Oxa1 family membrane protein insertase [Candidatus Saccharimonadales bacterium]